VDWPRARAILLAAFTVVNLILAYSIWGPSGLSLELSTSSSQQSVHQLREKLLAGGLVLPSSVIVPRTPPPMRFLHVEAVPTPELTDWTTELFEQGPVSGPRDSFGPDDRLVPMVDPETHAVVLWPHATGAAAREVKLDNKEQIQKATEDYLRQIAFLPSGARLSGIVTQPAKETVVVEYVPFFEGLPVYSGYVRAEVSARGIESVAKLWVAPRGYTDAPAKAVRPAEEALLRLAGRFMQARQSTITDIQLGYYAGRAFTLNQTGDIHGWDTIPVWRITLDNGDVYYMNAFNGEVET
jgi:hypothetical protein